MRPSTRTRSEAGDAERWCAVPRAMRKWALGRPHEWGLIFGTPVPGYEAPQDTVEPYARVAAAMVRPIIEAKEAGRLRMDRPQREVSAALREAVSPVTEALFSEMPVEKVVLVLQAWTSVIGLISLEVFGHWRNTILDPEAFFDATVRDIADGIGLG